MIKTKFTEMFGIEKPIVQGGMQHLGIAEFASLVCNAGGMGTINITCYPGVDEFHEDVIKMKEFTNNKPFIVNISLVPDLTKGEEIFKYIDVCAKEGVAAIEFAGASPVEFMPACKEAGIKIIHKSPNAKVAASMARKGADVITIAGYEVAGHPSMDGIGTFVIANKAAKVCAEYGVPVLAAGGVADGKGLEFLHPIDLYTIFGNAMDNAIECVKNLQKQEKRQIDVLIHRQHQFLIVQIMNPVEEELEFEDNLPVTTKHDKAYHGYGLRSIKNSVKKYNGVFQVKIKDGCFCLKILFPIKE